MSRYEEVKKKRERSMGKGKKRRYKAEVDLENELEEINEKLDALLNNKAKDVLTESISEAFKCCVCLKVSSWPVVSTCCERLLGCKDCLAQWYSGDGNCPFCKCMDGKDKHFVLKGIDELNTVLSKLELA